MLRLRLVITLGLLCCVVLTGHASDATSPQDSSEEQAACDPDSDEPCNTGEDEEELDRGFDPCLINSSLPACSSEAKRGDPGADEEAPTEADKADDSG